MLTNTIESLRAAFDKASENASQLGNKAQQHNQRRPEIDSELAVAMADGNATLIEQLRAERTSIEAELRDIEPALTIASQRVAAADRELARAELPGLFPDVAAEHKAFVEGVNALNKLSSSMKAKAHRYRSRYTVASLPDKETSALHPGYATRLGHVAGHVENYLRDFPGTIDITADA